MLIPTCEEKTQKEVRQQNYRGRILIVEDEEDMIQLLDFRLKKEGYQTLVAANGRKACTLVESFQPDCVLLDILLPEMDGWQVCQFIRSHPEPSLSTTPVIMLTAIGDQNAKMRGLELGADGYIAKPYAMQEVLISCARLIGERRNRLFLQSEISRLLKTTAAIRKILPGKKAINVNGL